MDKVFDVDDLIQENVALRCELRNVLALLNTTAVRANPPAIDEKRSLDTTMLELQQKLAYYIELSSALVTEVGPVKLSEGRDAKADATLLVTQLRSKLTGESSSVIVGDAEKLIREVGCLQRNLQGERLNVTKSSSYQ
ncbi:hypothetical protein EON64_17970 [archaeon]|nr:MAG: hypothetical protein EON64_17970 [archaeon]